MLTAKLLNDYMEIFDEIMSGYEMCCGEFTQEQKDIIVEFLQVLKKIAEENND